MRRGSIVIVFMIFATLLGAFSINRAAAMASPQDNSGSAVGEELTVSFNSVQLDLSSPQSYAFGITVATAQGFTITRLHWDFGDGIFLDVPYCCESQVSEVRYHAYEQPGSYQVTVIAYDSGGNSGEATVSVGWPTPVPEFPSILIPVITAMFLVLSTGALTRKRNLEHQ
ncbi:MAG TPA: PKD domain-containing protein [Candidatus Acidoferrales bacterium]|nr:PKD domain-containing protein [Candidatus Acidoferrales bacterium]